MVITAPSKYGKMNPSKLRDNFNHACLRWRNCSYRLHESRNVITVRWLVDTDRDLSIFDLPPAVLRLTLCPLLCSMAYQSLLIACVPSCSRIYDEIAWLNWYFINRYLHSELVYWLVLHCISFLHQFDITRSSVFMAATKPLYNWASSKGSRIT